MGINTDVQKKEKEGNHSNNKILRSILFLHRYRPEIVNISLKFSSANPEHYTGTENIQTGWGTAVTGNIQTGWGTAGAGNIFYR